MLRDGFAGQRLRVLPGPLATRAAQEGLTARLLVTDSGYFPRAHAHGRIRARGIGQGIVIVCVGGRGWVQLDGVRSPVMAGQVVLVPAGRPHSYGSSPDQPWTIWWLHVVGEDVPDLLAATGVPAGGGVVDVADPHGLAGLVDAVISRMERDETRGSLLAASGAAWRLLALIAADRTEGRTAPVERAQQYLRDHLAEPVTVAALADAAGLSPSHFAAVFRAAAGVPVLTYLKLLRMATARELLDTTDLPVAEVGRRVGYPDPFYFSRQFRSVHHVAPTAFRAQRR